MIHTICWMIYIYIYITCASCLLATGPVAGRSRRGPRRHEGGAPPLPRSRCYYYYYY